MVDVIPGIQTNSQEDAQEKLKSLEKLGGVVKIVHIDVCDGRFVDNLTIDAAVISKLKTKLDYNLHLMIKLDGEQIFQFEKTRAEALIFYPKAAVNCQTIIAQIKHAGKKVGIASDPQDSVDVVKQFLVEADLALVLAVKSGFAGQQFQPGVLPKISAIREINPRLKIGVDGGIRVGTAKLAAVAGADFIVANTAIWQARTPELGFWALKKDISNI